MSHNWRNYDKKLKFKDATNTRKIDAFFSKQKSIETQELEVVLQQSENRPSSSDTMIDFVEQSQSRPLASTSSGEHEFVHVSESETWFQSCILKLCLTHYKTTNFRLFQTERVCRQQFQI